VTGGWRRLYNEELHNLHSSLYIIRVIKSVGGDVRGVYHTWDTREMNIKFNSENLKRKDFLRDIGVGRKIILKLILKK
jgi:hypothetical protein